jgi:hypothetical protein
MLGDQLNDGEMRDECGCDLRYEMSQWFLKIQKISASFWYPVAFGTNGQFSNDCKFSNIQK